MKMNELSTLCQSLTKELPDSAVLELDASAGSDQARWLDIRYAGKLVVVEWRPQAGFGVSLLEEADEDPADGLFEGPDEVFRDWREAKGYILSLIHDPDQESWPRRAAHG